jgi:heat shock protein HslJ
MACADASAAEAQFLSALEQTLSFAILGDVLILIDGKGVTTAEFTAVYL